MAELDLGPEAPELTTPAWGALDAVAVEHGRDGDHQVSTAVPDVGQRAPVVVEAHPALGDVGVAQDVPIVPGNPTEEDDSNQLLPELQDLGLASADHPLVHHHCHQQGRDERHAGDEHVRRGVHVGGRRVLDVLVDVVGPAAGEQRLVEGPLRHLDDHAEEEDDGRDDGQRLEGNDAQLLGVHDCSFALQAECLTTHTL